MRPTTLFSNHDGILRSTNVKDVNAEAIDVPGRPVSFGSRAFSMFNDLPDDALRASRGFHMSAKVVVGLIVAGTLGAYGIAREARQDNSHVTHQAPASIEQAPAVTAPAVPEPVVSQPAADSTTILPAHPDKQTSPSAPAAISTPKPTRARVASTPTTSSAPAGRAPDADSAPTPVVSPPAPAEIPVPVDRAPELPAAPPPSTEVPAPAQPANPTPADPAPADPAPDAPEPSSPLPAPALPGPAAPVPPPMNPAAPAPTPAN